MSKYKKCFKISSKIIRLVQKIMLRVLNLEFLTYIYIFSTCSHPHGSICRFVKHFSRNLIFKIVFTNFLQITPIKKCVRKY